MRAEQGTMRASGLNVTYFRDCGLNIDLERSFIELVGNGMNQGADGDVARRYFNLYCCAINCSCEDMDGVVSNGIFDEDGSPATAVAAPVGPVGSLQS
ncbi:hypothetical protein TNCV_4761661 [Trichonephila clavipes]|uniref:Uncharacterized protein n=1 Tax=Trichonephila clavipes TaxID=2585209 RepID=A0A8X6V319_TRICX|nr:hypothetical protein TNCV_4761661 [Trichonephila clavipes]